MGFQVVVTFIDSFMDDVTYVKNVEVCRDLLKLTNIYIVQRPVLVLICCLQSLLNEKLDFI